MRLAALACVIALFAAACSAGPELVVTGTEGEPDEAPAEPVATPTPAETDLSALLLTAADVPAWQHSGPMDFGAEPTFVADDCELMNQAWAANTYPGTRTRASIEGATLRHTVVELEDEATAAAVLDAADRVWEECVEFSIDGSPWWAEPISVPPAGWRSSGLVIGGVDGITWAIAYWQRDNVIVLLEVDGDRTFQYLQPLLAAAAGRLTGTPAPVPVGDVPGTAPKTATEPEPRPTLDPNDDIAVPPVDDPPLLGPDESDDWRIHPLAVYVPDASEIGADYMLNSSDVTEYAESEPNGELEECGLTEPPTLEGIEVSYTAGLDYDNAVNFVVNRGSAADVKSYLDVFRALPGCDPEVMGFYDAIIEITTETIAVDGADDALVLRFSGTADEVDLAASYLVISYGELLFAMTTGSFGVDSSIDPLSVDQMREIIERAADRA
jgi:hypothetical protein